MSATSFGGSFELTRTDDAKTRGIFQKRLVNTALHTQFPFLKYIPYTPSPKSPEMDEMIEQIVFKRRKALEAGEKKKDLLQIFLDTHDANPDEFTVDHIYDEMRLFMFVSALSYTLVLFFVFLPSTYQFPGLLAATPPQQQQHLQSSSFSKTPPNSSS